MQRRINIWSNLDWLTISIYLLLIFLGWINIYAAVYNEEHHSIFDFSMRYGKQLVWISAAIVLAFLVLIIDINFYSYFAYIIYAAMMFLLLAVLIFGKEINGATSWFQIGTIRIQPSEFAKVATALAVAKYLSSFNVKINTFKSYFRLAAIILTPALLILLQNDTGSAIVYVIFIIVLYREGLTENVIFLGLFLILLFVLALVLDQLILIGITVATVFLLFWFLNRNLKHTFYGLGILIAIAGLSYGLNILLGLNLSYYLMAVIAVLVGSFVFTIVALTNKIKNVIILSAFVIGSIIYSFSVDYVFNNFLGEHQQNRINVTLGLASDPYGIEYNVNQSKIAIGSGGLTGKGFLRGTQTKFDFVPEQSTDFIFCTIGEEWGFLGTSFVVVVFIFLLYRLIGVAERQRSTFSRVYGYGVVAVLFFHIAINVGMTIGLVPVIGIPLPFFSYGGSSLWAFTILLFILLRLDASRLELL